MMIQPVGKPPKVPHSFMLMSPSIVSDSSSRPVMVIGIKQLNSSESAKAPSAHRSITQDLHGRQAMANKANYRQESFFKKRSTETILSSQMAFSRLDAEKVVKSKLISALQTRSMRMPENGDGAPSTQIRLQQAHFRVALKANASKENGKNGSSSMLRMASVKKSGSSTQNTSCQSKVLTESLTPVMKTNKEAVFQAPSPTRHLRKKDYIMKSMSREDNGQVKERIYIQSKTEQPTGSTAGESKDDEIKLNFKFNRDVAVPVVSPPVMKKKVKRGKKYMEAIASLNPELDINKLNDILADIPKITAKYWLAYDVTGSKVLFGYKGTQKREVASLTKLMTLYTAFDVIQEHQLDAKTFMCKVSNYAGSIGGTTANLKGGDILSLHDLLFGRLK